MTSNDVPDDRMTVIALGGLAYMLQSVLHEGVGHGVAAWLSGAHVITVSTVAMNAEIDSRWISAAGTLVNLTAALVLWVALKMAVRVGVATRYFLVLAFAGNLFTGTGYFLFSGVAGFGDWEMVIHGLHPYWAFRMGLVMAGVLSYAGAVWLVVRELRPFAREDGGKRLKGLTWTPYFTEAALAAAAGVLNPAGAIYVLLSALPATLGANSGLVWIRYYVRPLPEGLRVGRIERSLGWVVVTAIVGLVFLFGLGRGVTWHRG